MKYLTLKVSVLVVTLVCNGGKSFPNPKTVTDSTETELVESDSNEITSIGVGEYYESVESEKNNDEDSLETLESWGVSNPEDTPTDPQITSLSKIDDLLDPLTSPSTISTSTENVKIDESEVYEEEISSENWASESQETDLEYQQENHTMNLTEGSTNTSNDVHLEEGPTNEVVSQNSIPTMEAANEEENENESREHLASSNDSSLLDDLKDSTVTVMSLSYETTSLSSFNVDESDPVMPTNSTLLDINPFVLHSSTPDTEIIRTTFNDSHYPMTTEVAVEELPPTGEDSGDSDDVSESSEESQLSELSNEAFPDPDYAPEVISRDQDDDKHANSDTTLTSHSAEEAVTPSTYFTQVTEQNRLGDSDESIKQTPSETFTMTTILLLLTEASTISPSATSLSTTPSDQPTEPPNDKSTTSFPSNLTVISPPPNKSSTGGVQRSDSPSICLLFSLVFLLGVK